MFLVSSCSCLCTIQWSRVLSREWRCSWSSADRRCSNYIWVIDNVIAYKGASYIRDLTLNKIMDSGNGFILFLQQAINLIDDKDQLLPYIAKPKWTNSLIPERHGSNINTLKPRQNGRYEANNIFTCIFLNENIWISIKISLKFLPRVQLSKCQHWFR